MFPHERDRRPTILETLPSAREALTPELERVMHDNQRMRVAGNKLAAAAIHVANEYDGCHRLLQAASEWLAVIASEGGRPHGSAAASSPGAAAS